MIELLAGLKRRKLVQWALAYIAFAFALIQVIDVVAQRFGWPAELERILILALAVGFIAVLVIAWYHGEKGRQRVSGAELLLIALVLAVGGAVAWQLGREGSSATPTKVATVARTGAHAAALSSPDFAARTATSGLRVGSLDAAQRNPGMVAAQPIPAQSIAVLPFVNLSGDPKQAYFSDGITVEILNALAQIPKLKVAGRTSAFAFKGKEDDTREIGKVLGVATVLEGSVQKAGDEVRVTVQLVDTRSGYQLWSENYDRKLTNIFAIEDEISNAVANKLRVQWGGGTSRPLVAQNTVDPRAHDFYLSGLAQLAARASGLRGAVAAFQSAVKIDPHYAQAWGALAETEVILPEYQSDVSISVAYAQAKAAAERALAIDPNIAAAYVALSVVDGMQWAKRDQAIRRALQLAPGNAEVVFQHAYFLLITGNLDAALREMDHALRLNPLSPIIGAERVEALLYLHRYDDALRQADATIKVHPGFPTTYGYAALAAVQLRRFATAHAYVDRAASLQDFTEAFGNPAASLSQYIQGMSDPSQRTAALHAVAHSGSVGYEQAQWFCALGANAQAIDAMELAARSDVNPDLAAEDVWSPLLDPIRDDPRFKAVLKKMGLPYTPSTDAMP
ncbi:MAG: tetratricopeptide repeat protein [Rhodanobacteraceae bacterium]